MPRPSDVIDEIIALIGEEAAVELCRAFGGQTIYVPGFRRFAAARRNQQIVEALQSGRQPCDVAREFGISARHVHRISRTRFACISS